MKLEKPVIASLLDNDLYTLTVGQVAFHLFPRASATYTFFDRSSGIFPPGFAKSLNWQLELLSVLSLTKEEVNFLKTIPYLRPTYIEWLNGYRFDPSEVGITQDENGYLSITIKGPWYRTVYWEIVLLALTSELYFRMTNQSKCAYWKDRIYTKSKKLSDARAYWMEFGTRRRFSQEVQDQVVGIMRDYNGFLGTSNVHLAMKHNVAPGGTYSHQGPMAMSALYGVRMADKMWMKHWSEFYDGLNGTALTDSYTTDKFLESFGSYEARLFDGLRQDSGNPFSWGEKVLAHYKKLGVPTSNKRLVFSDNLDADKYIEIHQRFCKLAQPIGGIGTNFSNDVFTDEQKEQGIRPLNIVIKLTELDGIPVVKLSDVLTKNTGNPEAVKLAKQTLGI